MTISDLLEGRRITREIIYIRNLGNTVGFLFHKFLFYSPPPTWCGASDWPGLCLFCCSQPSCVVRQQSLFWAFFFINFPNLTPPPQQTLCIPALEEAIENLKTHNVGGAMMASLWFKKKRLNYSIIPRKLPIFCRLFSDLSEALGTI